MAEAKLGIPVRMGEPENASGDAVPGGPMYATGVGLVLHAVEEEWSEYDDLMASLREKFWGLKRVLTQPVSLGFRRSRAECGIQKHSG